MVTILLQLVGVAFLSAFLFVVWPPLVLAAVGAILLVGPEIVARRR